LIFGAGNEIDSALPVPHPPGSLELSKLAILPFCRTRSFLSHFPKTKKPARGRFLIFGAGNEIRTRDPNLGKVVLYQLSYSREVGRILLKSCFLSTIWEENTELFCK
jgi:hypothetical protein